MNWLMRPWRICHPQNDGGYSYEKLRDENFYVKIQKSLIKWVYRQDLSYMRSSWV